MNSLSGSTMSCDVDGVCRPKGAACPLAVGTGGPLRDLFVEGVACVEPLLDGSGRVTDARCREANATAARWLGLSRERVVGRRLSEAVGPRRLKEAVRILQGIQDRLSADGPLATLEARLGRRWIRLNAVRHGGRLFLAASDLSAELRAVRDVGEARNRLRLILDNVSEAILQLDRAAGVVWASPAAAELLDLHPDTLRGGAFTAALEAPARGRLLAEVAAPLPASGRRVALGEVRYAPNSGEAMTLDALLIRSRADGRPGQNLLFLRDVTGQRAAEELNLRYERARTRGATAAGLAHEIRNPMATIATTIELLAEGEFPRSEMGRHLGVVMQQVRRVREVVRNVLSFGQVQDRPDQGCDLAVIAPAAVRLARDQFGPGAEACRVDLAGLESAPTLAMRPGEMEQVLSNLVLNAFQAMDGRGRVTVAVRPVEQGRLEVSVSDTGPGVPEERRNRVLEPFFTTKSTGSGLGLWVCENLLRVHGSGLEISEAPGGGARLSFRLKPWEGI